MSVRQVNGGREGGGFQGDDNGNDGCRFRDARFDSEEEVEEEEALDSDEEEDVVRSVGVAGVGGGR